MIEMIVQTWNDMELIEQIFFVISILYIGVRLWTLICGCERDL